MVKKLMTLVVFMSLIMLSGCQNAKLPYNAVMYGNVYETRAWLRDDFYESNLTYGSYSTAIEDYIKDENFPSSHTKILQNEDEYEMVFKEFPTDVDFGKSLIVMHCFTTVSGSFYEIKNISRDEKKLLIQYRTVKSKKHTPDASIPLSKWIIVTLDYLDIETVEFIFDN